MTKYLTPVLFRGSVISSIEGKTTSKTVSVLSTEWEEIDPSEYRNKTGMELPSDFNPLEDVIYLFISCVENKETPRLTPMLSYSVDEDIPVMNKEIYSAKAIPRTIYYNSSDTFKEFSIVVPYEADVTDLIEYSRTNIRKVTLDVLSESFPVEKVKSYIDFSIVEDLAIGLKYGNMIEDVIAAIKPTGLKSLKKLQCSSDTYSRLDNELGPITALERLKITDRGNIIAPHLSVDKLVVTHEFVSCDIGEVKHIKHIPKRRMNLRLVCRNPGNELCESEEFTRNGMFTVLQGESDTRDDCSAVFELQDLRAISWRRETILTFGGAFNDILSLQLTVQYVSKVKGGHTLI